MFKTAWNSIRSFTNRLSQRVKSIFKGKSKLPQPSGFHPGQVSNPLFSGTETVPGAAYQKGAWTLHIYYRNPGTRSQGQHGVLLKDGVEVKPGQAGEILQTDLGALQYLKDPEQISFLWDSSGWDFVGERPAQIDSVAKI